MRLADDQRRGLVLPPDPPGGRHLPEGAAFTLRDAGKAKFTTTTIALMIARRLGQTERTSIGVKFDYQEDRSSLSSDTNWSTGTDFRQDKDTILGHRKGFTAGITHDFGGDKKLGVYYSYNTGPFRSQSHYTQRYEFVELKTFFPGLPESEFSDSQSRRLSEVGARFRGSVTRRLFYGVEASLLDERRRLEFQDVFIPATGESGVEIRHARTRSAAFGAGVGYALRRRTVLGIDLSAGGALENRWTEHRSPPGVESSDSFGNERSDFWSLHIGGQTDLWRNLYVGGSRLLLSESSKDNYRVVFKGKTYFSSQDSLEEKSKLSNLSLGWRMTPSWIVQYTYFTSYGRYAPSYTLLFRYEFGRQEEE